MNSRIVASFSGLVRKSSKALFQKVYEMTLDDANGAFLAFHRVKPKRRRQ